MDGARTVGFSGSARFQILRRLGAGGTGEVYQALDRAHGARVAIKVLHALAPAALARFKHELRTLQALEHPNLVSLGELVEANGQWLFTMELVDGVDFLSYVRPHESRRPDGDTVSAELRRRQHLS